MQRGGVDRQHWLEGGSHSCFGCICLTVWRLWFPPVLQRRRRASWRRPSERAARLAAAAHTAQRSAAICISLAPDSHLGLLPTMTCNAVAWSGRVTQLATLPSLAACRHPCSWLQAVIARTQRVAGSRPEVSSRAATALAGATDQVPIPSPPTNSVAPQLDADEFSCMLETLREWKHLYYDCNVPRRVRA